MSIHSNAAEQIGRLERVRSEASSLLADAIADTSRDTVEALRAATPVDSGDLRDAWTAYPTASGAVIENPLPYATNRGPNIRDVFPALAVEAAVKARVGRILE